MSWILGPVGPVSKDVSSGMTLNPLHPNRKFVTITESNSINMASETVFFKSPSNKLHKQVEKKGNLISSICYLTGFLG